ncbi:MAG: peptide-methionine (S)-S-oxide reductase MsrA [Propionibacteriales bacterium]|nr:peptide-methionine (S)-S-oxide reductase MsrA [Propionibacteriales bacterium]
MFGRRKTELPTRETALPGRDVRLFPVPELHAVLGTPIEGQVPEGMSEAVFGLGCFWSVEKAYWGLPGVWTTAAGYAGGVTPNPTYDEVCSGGTGHAEVVRMVFDPAKTSYGRLLKEFWEHHDPTQGMRQGNDHGTQYRSIILTVDEDQRRQAEESRAMYQEVLSERGLGMITTEILPLENFWYAEDYHQQYLIRNPGGYCPDHSTGIACPIDTRATGTTGTAGA